VLHTYEGNMENSTIAAIATPSGSGGIGIVRISGSRALSIASSIFCHGSLKKNLYPSKASDSKKIQSFTSHKAYYGHIINPETRCIIDEVLLIPMIVPNSYTREDVVEIQAHSGHMILQSILTLILQHGANIAEPGEFTRRAFLNGRIDLSQAEAVMDIINAKTEKALEIASAQKTGYFREHIESIRNYLLDVLAEIEAAIDFPDEMEDFSFTFIEPESYKTHILDKIHFLLQQYNSGHVFRDGIRVFIAGRPNVGKSSIFNCLIQKDRSIVTPFPGTTRDFIEETINLSGLPVNVMDTAGLHETDDPVEVIGIQKACENISASDLILFVVDGSYELTVEDKNIYHKIKHKPFIIILNKTDLIMKTIENTIPQSWNQRQCVETSALHNKGINEIKNAIINVALDGKNPDTFSAVVPNIRHKLLLEKCLKLVCSASRSFSCQEPAELTSIEIREAIGLMDDIIGINPSYDVLDQIFSRFCLGK
jgi:tRNA modification GTPase